MTKPQTTQARKLVATKALSAVNALRASVTTHADKDRLDKVWAGLHALDEEHAATKDKIDLLLKSWMENNDAHSLVSGLEDIVKCKIVFVAK